MTVFLTFFNFIRYFKRKKEKNGFLALNKKFKNSKEHVNELFIKKY